MRRFCTLLASFSLYFLQATSDPCPFNENECQCTSTSAPLTFSQATCTSDGLPKFESPSSKFGYTIQGKLLIRGNLQVIPAWHFEVFESIGELHLNSTIPGDQNWDPMAFAGMKVTELTITGVDGLFPRGHAPWMATIGRAGLKTLSISNCQSPIHLSEGAFTNLPDIRKLEILHCPISSISFSGLTKSMALHSLTIKNASLREFLVPDEGFSLIESLNLDHNGPLKIRGLSKWDILETVSLRGNSLASSINQGGLDDLSGTVSHLYLDHGDLDSIPRRLLDKNQLSASLSLAHNRIQTIQDGDLDQGDDLHELILRSNPIQSIQEGAFANLHHVARLDLRHTKLDAIDLRIFNGVGSRITGQLHLQLDHNRHLKRITASDFSQFTTAKTIISITNTTLQTVHANLARLLADPKLDIQIDLSNNVHLHCTGLDWMADFLCNKKLKIDGAKCADQNGKPLIAVLKIDDSKSCSSQQPSSTQIPVFGAGVFNPKSSSFTRRPSWSDFVFLSMASFLLLFAFLTP